jgi:plastocyanin
MNMVSRKNMTTILALAVSVFIAWGAAKAGAQEKANASIISIKDLPDGISPASVTVQRGDTVVWYNQGKEPVAIIVKQRIGIVCSPLVNFNADPAGNYRTGSIPHGSTASLCFLHGGEYNYEVRWLALKDRKPTGKAAAGKIAVE